MIRIRYLVEFPSDDRPTQLPGDTHAVTVESCKEYDAGQGGVTTEEVDPADVQPLVVFPAGSELFVESGNSADCLDDTDDQSAARTRIWWRVTIIGVAS